MKYVSASTMETAFNCPHCGALAQQSFYSTSADELDKNDLPIIIDAEKLKKAQSDYVSGDNVSDALMNWLEEMHKGHVFFSDSRFSHGRFSNSSWVINNLWISKCFNCDEVAIWLCDRLMHPQRGDAPPANPDLPAEIRRDYEEASAILELSPRGAAALIRLAIQKLCRELGKPGKNANEDIGALVSDGLNPKIQQALDYVRVVGNNAVHPGQIDLSDDRATAATLLRLLNVIAEKMITEPKHINQIYGDLPEGALKAIERRDGEK